MNEGSAFALSAGIIGLALVQQSAELLALGNAYRAEGVWGVPMLREDLALFPRPLAAALARIFEFSAFRRLLWVRLALGLSLVALPRLAPSLLLPAALLLSVLVCIRFRGVFNGGSDYMTIAVLLGLSIASTGPLLWRTGLYYVAVQSLASYAIAGIAKLGSKEWRTGRALHAFVALPHYGAPRWLQHITARPALGFVLSWSVILFECSAPASLLSLECTRAYIALAVLFHFGTLLAFGLNRFLWAWLASYPALYALSELLQR